MVAPILRRDVLARFLARLFGVERSFGQGIGGDFIHQGFQDESSPAVCLSVIGLLGTLTVAKFPSFCGLEADWVVALSAMGEAGQ